MHCDSRFVQVGRGQPASSCGECRRRCNAEGGCDRKPVKATGFCNAHYKRVQKGTDLTAPIRQWETGERKCKVKGCVETRITRSADYCQRHFAEHSVDYFRLWRYGMTPERFAELLAAQGGRCAICRTDDPQGAEFSIWTVDHDHACCPGTKGCGKCNRGLLCGNCNKGIGFFGDDPEVVESAAAYLRHYTKE